MPVTIRKNANGTIILVERLTGYAVSVREQNWSAAGRVHVYDWTCKGKGLTLDAANTLFETLAA